MYEAFFGLTRRPFTATPDPACCLALPQFQAALGSLKVCLEQQQGIGLLVGAPGTGKTLLCERLKAEWSDRGRVVFLRHGNFGTRRALLQTILSELGQSYQHPSDQELRLQLTQYLRELRATEPPVLLICDEASGLGEELLEDLRMLTDLAVDGQPLLQLVLSGQLPLDEALASPGLQPLNQRIGAHVTLEALTRAESWDYIDYRLTWAGGRTEELFAADALELIAHVCDGLPRCLNQLCDHTLLLAYVGDQRRVERAIVFDAVNDLRSLPLPWNEPLTSDSDLPADETDEAMTAAPEVEAAAESWQPEPASFAEDDGVEFVEVGAPSHTSAETFDRSAAESRHSWEMEHHAPSAELPDDTGVDDEAAAEVARAAAVHALEHRLDHMLERYRTARDEQGTGGLAEAATETPARAEADLEQELAEELQADNSDPADEIASWESRLREQTAPAGDRVHGDAFGTDPDLTGDVYYSEEILDPAAPYQGQARAGASFEPFSSPAELAAELPPAMDPLLGCLAVPIDHCHEPPFATEPLAEDATGELTPGAHMADEDACSPVGREWAAPESFTAERSDDVGLRTEETDDVDPADEVAAGDRQSREEAPAAEASESSVDGTGVSDRWELDLAGEALDLVYETRAKLSQRSHQFPPQMPRQQTQDFHDFVPLAEVDSEDAEYLEHVRQEWEDAERDRAEEAAAPDISSDASAQLGVETDPVVTESTPAARESLMGQYRNLFSLLRRRERRG